jgi:hypothetical protein
VLTVVRRQRIELRGFHRGSDRERRAGRPSLLMSAGTNAVLGVNGCARERLRPCRPASPIDPFAAACTRVTGNPAQITSRITHMNSIESNQGFDLGVSAGHQRCDPSARRRRNRHFTGRGAGRRDLALGHQPSRTRRRCLSGPRSSGYSPPAARCNIGGRCRCSHSTMLLPMRIASASLAKVAHLCFGPQAPSLRWIETISSARDHHSSLFPDRSCCNRLAAATRSRVWKPSENRSKIGSRSSSALLRWARPAQNPARLVPTRSSKDSSPRCRAS